MNNLVYVGKVLQLIPIEGADRIESAIVVCGEGGKWQGCVLKESFKVGDKCLVFRQDCIVPEIPEFEHMRKHKFRVRMCRFLKTPSEVLISGFLPNVPQDLPVGTDVGAIVRVTKYEKPIPVSMMGETKGNFPGFIPKTDEMNFQAVQDLLARVKLQPYWMTLKYDGTSATYYHNRGEVGVCSRNLEKKLTSNDVYNRINKEFGVTYKLQELGKRGFNYAIQGEIFGPNIQKNRMGAEKISFRAFDVYDIDAHDYLSAQDQRALLKELEIPMVDVVGVGIWSLEDFEDIRKLGEVKYQNGKEAEGVVVRVPDFSCTNGSRLSFKILNLNYKGN
jgi:RNA ligase (TIGR02306 family)